MIHVCFVLHDKTGRYSKFAGTAMLSLLENTTAEVTVHILHDNTLSQDNRDKFIDVANRYGQSVKFYNVEELCADKIAEFLRIPGVEKAWSTIGTLFKLLIPKVLPDDINECIYLDSDIVVNLNINELWQVELDNNFFAAVPEISNGIDIRKHSILCRKGYVKEDDYINAGVMLMNLKLLRNEDESFARGLKFRTENDTKFFDQDIWNYLFSKNYLKLPVKFNFFVKSHRELKEVSSSNNIYHYTYSVGGMGLGLDMRDPFNRLWFNYFAKTPWFDVEAVGRLYESFQQIYANFDANSRYTLMKFSAMMSGKTRAFFTAQENVEQLSKLFSIRDDEDIIHAENQESLQNLITAMRISQGKKLFFIFMPNFNAISKLLEKLGFVQSEDFINGVNFLPMAHGGRFNSYQLIKAM